MSELRDRNGRVVTIKVGDIVTSIYNVRYIGARGRYAQRYTVLAVWPETACSSGVALRVRLEGRKRGGPTLDLGWFRDELSRDYPAAKRHRGAP